MTRPNLDDAIDRAVREMMSVDPARGLESRVLARLESPRPVLFTTARFASAAALAAVVLAAIFLVRDPEPAREAAVNPNEPPPVSEPSAPVRPPQPSPAAPPRLPAFAGNRGPLTTGTRPPVADRAVAAAAVDEPGTIAVEPLAHITPIEVTPVELRSIAPGDIAIPPLAVEPLQLPPLPGSR
jgi:hypothetical protein